MPDHKNKGSDRANGQSLKENQPQCEKGFDMNNMSQSEKNFKNDITPFKFEGSDIRVADQGGSPWFVAADVCKVLEIANSRDALLKLDEDEKADVGLTDTSSNGVKQKRIFSIISESGMYTLVLRSKGAVKKGSPAHRFRKWVTSEVLPTIRKTGRYEIPQSPYLTPEQRAAIKAAVASRVATLPKAQQKGGYPQLYSAMNGRFGAPKYEFIRAEHFDAAMAFIGSYYFPASVAEIEGPKFSDLPDGLFVLGMENGTPLFLRNLREQTIVTEIAKLEASMFSFYEEIRRLSTRLDYEFSTQKHHGERDFLRRRA